METWYGAAGICINESSQLLMVLEGETAETQKWSIPTGGLEKGETFEQCMLREIEEETGYTAAIRAKIKIKKGVYEHLNIAYEVHYFAIEITGGKAKIQDPDEFILDIAWKPAGELRVLPLSYPEDREELLAFLAAPETLAETPST
ncbi:NUDIX hydrolase [Planococcus salinarum]|uniref:NUDIX hydrolase n=1 Tax=Planococcus salinarum TaxID=622695 RepID=UPI000E3E6D68|nr:NUDIX hydrolase [Planococcus salinarum]TAA72374.1 NUDIX hydrolase [Planococcus salinarum]